MDNLPVLPRRPRTDYIDPPPRIRFRTTAKVRGWYAGWPDSCPPASARTSLALVRPSDGHIFVVSVDTRLAQLYQTWLDGAMALGHELRGAMETSTNGKKQGGVGSYVCRAIKHSDPPQPSNHSSATALDLWTRSNPMLIGRDVPFASTVHPEVVELAAAADIYWGGWYWDARHNYVDAMHFEYMATPSSVPASMARLQAKLAEIKLRHEPVEPEDPDVTIEQVKMLQTQLNAIGCQPPLVVDGDYGPLTEAAVKNMPQLVAEQVDAAEATTAAETKQAAVEAVSGI